ncbi:MAG: hypothetical protein HQL37_03245 [Alphaproteobacteria bacterium]|nr:hypothetical protein [Alphaproteobacteria bacterium]
MLKTISAILFSATALFAVSAASATEPVAEKGSGWEELLGHGQDPFLEMLPAHANRHNTGNLTTESQNAGEWDDMYSRDTFVAFGLGNPHRVQ